MCINYRYDAVYQHLIESPKITGLYCGTKFRTRLIKNHNKRRVDRYGKKTKRCPFFMLVVLFRYVIISNCQTSLSTFFFVQPRSIQVKLL